MAQEPANMKAMANIYNLMQEPEAISKWMEEK
jgi:hypothetical protein